MFDTLVGSVDDYVSISYFRGYDPSIDLYCVCLEDLPRKPCRLHSLIFPMIYLRPLMSFRG